MKPPRSGILERYAQNIGPAPDAEGLRLKTSTAAQATHGAFWTVKDLALHLRISQRWIHERTRRDEIPCHRLGTAIRFDPHEIQIWMIQRRETIVGSRGAA